MNASTYPTQPTVTPDKPLLTIREFHDHLQGSVGINAIRDAVRNGRIKSLAVGERKRLIPSTELTAWVERETAVHA